MTDVVVVGGGLSGLLATWRLRTAGCSVRTLEARARLGGRLHRPASEAVDLGASWVWDDERHIHALLTELGLAIFDHHRDGTDRYEDGCRLQSGRLPRSHVPERRIVGGATAIIDALSRVCGPVETEMVVRRIDATTDGLRVHTDHEVIPAVQVVVALPPALLAHTVDLPALSPDDRAVLAACPTWMEDVAKVVVRYPRRFWTDRGLSGRAASRVGPLVEVHDLSGPGGTEPALFGFLPRPLYTADWQERVLAQLVRLFGPGAERPDAVHHTAWWTEAYTSTARRQPQNDRLIGHPRLRTPLLDGRLHLISTETAAGRAGHMDGAVERAEAVARFLIARSTSPTELP